MNTITKDLLWFLTRNPNLELVMSALLTSSAVVCVAWALALQLRNRSARARSMVWRIAMAMLLVVGVWRLLPDFSPPVAVVEWQVPMPIVEEVVPVLPIEPLVMIVPQRPWWKPVVAAVEEWSVISWLSVATVLMLWRVIGAFGGLFWLRKRSAEGTARISRLGGELGAPNHIRYRLAERLHSPMLTGWRRPVIWLPGEARTWDDARLSAVLRHELAHLERADVLWHWLGILTTSLWWWQPLVWMTRKRLSAETEQAADDVAVLADGDTHGYARTLVEIAAGLPTRLRSVAGVTMFGSEPIQQRVRELMKANRWRGRIGMGALSLIAIAAVILAVLVATKVEFVPQKPVYQSIAKLVAGGRMVANNDFSWQEQLTDFYGTIIETIEATEMLRKARERVRALNPELKDSDVEIHVAQTKGSSIFTILASGPDPKYTRIFLNALLDEFIAFRQSIREQAQGKVLSFFLQEVVNKQKAMEEKSEALTKFCNTHNVLTITDGQNEAAHRLSSLKEKRQSTKTRLAELGLVVVNIENARNATLLKGTSSNGMQLAIANGEHTPSQMEQVYLKTKSELFVLKNERDFLLKSQKPDHPEVVAADDKIAKAQHLLDSATQEIQQEMKAQAVALERTLTVLDQQIVELQREAIELGGTIAEHERLKAEAAITKDAYQKMFERAETFQAMFNTQSDYVAIQERATTATAHAQSSLFPVWKLWAPEKKEVEPESSEKKKNPETTR